MKKIETSQELYEKFTELLNETDINAVQQNEEKGEEEEEIAMILISKKGDQLHAMTAGTIRTLTETMANFLVDNPLLLRSLLFEVYCTKILKMV